MRLLRLEPHGVALPLAQISQNMFHNLCHAIAPFHYLAVAIALVALDENVFAMQFLLGK